jgi:hypothetical protein
VEFNGAVTSFAGVEREFGKIERSKWPEVAVSTRLLYCAMFINQPWTSYLRTVHSGIENGDLAPSALGLPDVVNAVLQDRFPNDPVGALSRPALILLDEVAKLSESEDPSLMRDVVFAVNNCLNTKLMALWTALAEGPFKNATTPTGRTVVPIPLYALSQCDSRDLIKGDAAAMIEIGRLADSMRKVNQGTRGNATLPVTTDALVGFLSSLSGGHPRTLEIVIATIRELSGKPYVRSSLPLVDFVERAKGAFMNRYSSAESMYLKALKLCMCRPKLERSTLLSFNSNSPSTVDDAVASGAMFESGGEGQTSSTVGLPPLVAFYVASLDRREPFREAVTALMEAIREGYGTVNFEMAVAKWIAVWSAAESTISDVLPSAGVVGQETRRLSDDAWRPFDSLVQASPEAKERIRKADLNTRLPLFEKKFTRDEMPSKATAAPGIYLPEARNFPGFDILVVIGDGADKLAIAINCKTTREGEEASFIDVKRLEKGLRLAISGDRKGKKNRLSYGLKNAGWTPGEDLHYMVMVLGEVPAEVASTLAQRRADGHDPMCVHLLHGEELMEVMGPTIAQIIEHWRTLSIRKPAILHAAETSTE